MPFRFINSLSILELSLIQVVMYSLIWFYDEYVATLLTIVVPTIIIGVLVISFISDKIEPSKVGRKYYISLIISAIIPLLVAAFFVWAYEGVLDYIE